MISDFLSKIKLIVLKCMGNINNHPCVCKIKIQDNLNFMNLVFQQSQLIVFTVQLSNCVQKGLMLRIYTLNMLLCKGVKTVTCLNSSGNNLL